MNDSSLSILLSVAAAAIPTAGASPQVGFVDRTNLLQDTGVRSGFVMGVADMNGDGRDDIVRLDVGRILRVEYQGTPGGAFGTHVHESVSSSRQWGLCIADVDHNGARDIFTGGAYDGAEVHFANATGTTYTSVDLPGPTLFVQTANFVDIDGDGWLDIFACHDDAESHKYRNDGQGGFEFAPGMMDTTTTPASDNSGNYGSLFTDYDGDGDVDLYISKCRIGVNSSSDPRRINKLLRNDGQTWTEVGATAGLDFGQQSWAADFGDLDGDGDMDAFVVNHYEPSVLMRNNGDGTFTDVTAASGLAADLTAVPIQVAFRDFDNDGNLDLLIAGDVHRLFLGDGALGFTLSANPFPGPQMESFALGDLNDDGFVDVYGGYARIINTPSTTPDRLYLNTANSNNWLKVGLVGTTSNRDGVGARVELTADDKLQVREVRSGESYGICHSLDCGFGLAAAGVVDRVRVIWPSGVVDELRNVDVNQRLEIVEGSTGVRNLRVALIGTSFNDAEESDQGVVWRRNQDLELVEDGARGDQVVGMRYALDVPPDVTVLDAWIQFTAEGRDFDEANLFISAEAADDAAPIKSFTSNLSLRPRTMATVAWSPPQWTLIGRRSSLERTPSLRAVIQEVIDRDGWSAGNHALLLVTGTGRRSAYSSDAGLSLVGVNSNPNAPTLHVLYSDRHVATSAVRGALADGEERTSGYVTMTSPDLELVDDGSNLGQVVGLRFEDVAVPPGATIERAYLQFTVDEITLGTCALSVAAEANGAPAPLGAVSRNFTSRTQTAATVDWPVLPWERQGAAEFAQRSPDLSPIVQELVDRPDWAFNTDAVFLLSGQGTRTAEAFEGGAARSPRLVVEFSVGGGNGAPYVDAGDDIALDGMTSARLAATYFDDQRDADLLWSKLSGPGAVTFADATAASTTAVFGTAGTYVLRLAVDDGTSTASDDITVTVSGVGTTIIRAITASADDAEESDVGSVWRGNDDLELVADGVRGNQTIGLRFTGLSIPQGATITSATIQFTADETGTDPASLVLRAQAIGDAPGITGVGSNISSRPLGAASVGWQPQGWGAGIAGPAQRTPNLAVVLHEVVSRPDWAPGQAALFVITGTGQRVASSIDGNPSGAAVLTVTYQ